MNLPEIEDIHSNDIASIHEFTEKNSNSSTHSTVQVN